MSRYVFVLSNFHAVPSRDLENSFFGWDLEEFSRPRDGLLDLITANIKVEGESRNFAGDLPESQCFSHRG